MRSPKTSPLTMSGTCPRTFIPLTMFSSRPIPPHLRPLTRCLHQASSPSSKTCLRAPKPSSSRQSPCSSRRAFTNTVSRLYKTVEEQRSRVSTGVRAPFPVPCPRLSPPPPNESTNPSSPITALFPPRRRHLPYRRRRHDLLLPV